MTFSARPGFIDSPGMRQAGRDALSLALIDARNHTLCLLAQHEAAATLPDRVAAQEMDHVLPKWLAGHAGWFAERWIGRNPQRGLGSACPAQPVRLVSIESRADFWWELAPEISGRNDPALPDFDATRAYLLETLESTQELLDRTDDSDEALYFYRLALFHEDLLGEQLLTLAQTRGVPLALEPPPATLPRDPLGLPGARWRLGSEPGGFVVDNEKWAHEVAVPAFEIDAQPVTWSQYVEFVDDGGYDRPELWQAEGWAWLQEMAAREGRRGPRHVEQIGAARFGGAGAVLQARWGRPLRLAGHHPVTHVSWWEADAWCRWANRRLPDEAEWELAAHTAARRGFRWGDVLEWTASRFRPYPGFTPDPWDAYSLPWFGRTRVLRGASWITCGRLRTPRLRRFGLPERDELFVGFRSCAL
jgi:ergothioneine biosynthesis protein EgtB